MATKIAYAIARESSDDRTLQNQYDTIKKVAKELGYKIVKEFGENITGDASKRDGAFAPFIEKLNDAIRERKPDAIFIAALDRLTRTTREQGYFLTEFSAIKRIPMYFAKENVWTIDPKTGVLNEAAMKRMAADTTPQNERENIKARTAPQRNKNGKEGYYIGHLSDGYCVEESWGTYEDGHRRKIKKIIVDEDRKKVIEDIYKWYRNGYTINKIADLLNSKNVLTTNAYRASTPEKFGHRQKYKGKDGIVRERSKAKWNGSLVSQILSNPWYKGEREFDGVKLTHDAIIPKEIWDEVKAIREERKLTFRNKREATVHIYLLSDLFFCGKCGSKMYGHYGGLNNNYYCSSADFQTKCGLTGICKENIEAIIYDIIRHKALSSVFNGNNDFMITDYFNLDKNKEKEYKDDIENSKRIIVQCESEIDKANKSIEFLIHEQRGFSDNPAIVNYYRTEIRKTYDSIRDNEKKINKNQLEIKRLNQLLSSNNNIKEILRNIAEDKEPIIIKQLFKQVIDNVVIYNAGKRDDVVRITFKNGNKSELIYCHRLLGYNYILLKAPLYYDEERRLIVSSCPISISIYQNYHVLFNYTKSEVNPNPNLKPGDTKDINIDNGITVKEFIKLVRNTDLSCPFERLEEEPEIAKAQREHYQHWRKKYNTGMPKGIEPYILHNETYEEIQVLRNRLYKKTYKIKMRKTLSDEEKEAKIAEIKRQLDALTVQVPLIKPRKKRTSKKHDDEELRKAFEEPAE